MSLSLYASVVLSLFLTHTLKLLYLQISQISQVSADKTMLRPLWEFSSPWGPSAAWKKVDGEWLSFWLRMGPLTEETAAAGRSRGMKR